jgi:WD40 repeat protein
MKGKLDLTTYAALAHGGKTGPAFIAGDPEKSPLIEQVSGDDPQMPDKGQKLSATEVNILTQWVKQGAKDDSVPGEVAAVGDSDVAPVKYAIAPVISAIAASPDGALLAVGGWHEILLHRADGSEIVARMASCSPRITSMRFSADGAKLVAAGGSPGEFGTIEVFDVAGRKRVKRFAVSSDTVFGLSLSPTADRAAVACADKTVRVIDLEDGKEVDNFGVHSDWALGAAFTMDGTRVASCGRDKNLFLLDLKTHKAIDPVADPNDPFTCLARDPNKDQVLCGTSKGQVRLYRLTDLQNSTEQKREPNRIKEWEGQAGPVNAIEYSADGTSVAVAGAGEVRVFSEAGKRRFICTGHQGAVYAIAFSPDGTRLFTGGYDGRIRVFDMKKGELIKTFAPTPLKEGAVAVAIPASK